MKRIYHISVFMIILLAGLLALSGCQAADTTTTGTTTAATAVTTTAPTTTAVASTAAPASTTAPAATTSTPAEITITDDIGRAVHIKGVPQKIISLAPSNTEIVYALGLQDRLIGVTTWCNYPPEVKDKPKVSEYSKVDVEKLVSLQPDLILASDIQKTDSVPALEKLGIPVAVITPDTIDAVFKDIQMIGQITGKTQEATSLVSSLQQRVKAVTDKVAAINSAKTRILYVTWHDPLWTAGSNTMIDELINKVGGTNIASDLSGYATLGLEEVVNRNPQVIIVMTSMGVQAKSLEYIQSEPRLQATDALKNQQVYAIDADIFGRTTPRIVDGLETLAKMVHPDAFK